MLKERPIDVCFSDLNRKTNRNTFYPNAKIPQENEDDKYNTVSILFLKIPNRDLCRKLSKYQASCLTKGIYLERQYFRSILPSTLLFLNYPNPFFSLKRLSLGEINDVAGGHYLEHFCFYAFGEISETSPSLVLHQCRQITQQLVLLVESECEGEFLKLGIEQLTKWWKWAFRKCLLNIQLLKYISKYNKDFLGLLWACSIRLLVTVVRYRQANNQNVQKSQNLGSFVTPHCHDLHSCVRHEFDEFQLE